MVYGPLYEASFWIWQLKRSPDMGTFGPFVLSQSTMMTWDIPLDRVLYILEGNAVSLQLPTTFKNHWLPVLPTKK